MLTVKDDDLMDSILDEIEDEADTITAINRISYDEDFEEDIFDEDAEDDELLDEFEDS